MLQQQTYVGFAGACRGGSILHQTEPAPNEMERSRAFQARHRDVKLYAAAFNFIRREFDSDRADQKKQRRCPLYFET
jgi:hypothetical protein